MRKVVNRLFIVSVFAFLVLSVFFAGRLISHTISGGYLTPHQMLRSLILTGGAAVLLFLTQMLMSIREMNHNYRESSHWS